ncbi:MAG: ArnT family glycosyltransferase [Bacilli bacterium]
MGIWLFIFANLFVAVSAVNWSCRLLDGFRDRIVGVFLFAIAQIMIVMFVSGRIFGSLDVREVFLLNATVAAISVFPIWMRDRRLIASLAHPRLFFSGIGITGFLYGSLTVLALLATAAAGYLLPPYASDELGYHLVAVATWMHAGRIVDSNFSLWSNVYPKNAELLYAWLYLFVRNDSFVHLGQWLFALAGIAATAGCARLLGLNRGASIVAGSLYFFAPTVLTQATTDYVDLAFASLFLVFLYFALSYSRQPSLRHAFAAGVAGGITLGVKSDAALYIGVYAVVMLIHGMGRGRRDKQPPRRLWAEATAFVIPLFSLGMYWYIHTWIVYHNPVYPFIISVMGHTIFGGLGTVQALIMIPNTPAQLLRLPFLEQVWLSWTGIPSYVGYDMPIGGFGPQWTLLEMPALFVFTAYSGLRDRRTFSVVTLPLWIIFLLQPSNWWARYTLFMVAFGAWAFVYIVERFSRDWIRNGLYGLMLAVLVGTCSVGAVLLVRPSAGPDRDRPTMWDELQLSLRLPPQERTVGRIILPAYAWVDSLRKPAVIGFTPAVPYPYPLFGRHAQNDVIKIMVKNPFAFRREIVRDHVEYLMTKAGDPQYRAAIADPTLFRVYSRHESFTVFAVVKAGGAA